MNDKNNKPIITIVTVTYNAENQLEETIRSIIGQSYDKIDYILVDGASTDGTGNIIKKYNHKIDQLVIEPDNGIYDAMNKAIDLAKGDWIIFINAGDRFCSTDVLKKVFNINIPPEIDFIYGDYIWEGINGQSIVKSKPLKDMWRKISFSHQSLFSRTRIMKSRKFSTKLKIVSDYEFYFSAYMEGSKFLKINYPISIFSSGGVSDKYFLMRTWERWSVVKRFRNDLGFHFYYLRLIISNYYNKTIKYVSKSR